MERRLKKGVVYALYSLAFITIVASIYLIQSLSLSKRLDDNNVYVNKTILDNDIPVVSVSNIIKRPYTGENINIGINFYNSSATDTEQQQSLIYYENTYMPNSGVDYKSDSVFDVVAVMDGTVTKVTENTLLGKIIEVSHANNLVSVYQSLSSVKVKEGEVVIQGQIIASSGTSTLSKELGNHLHFELILNGVNINPENSYDKKISELY